MKDSIKYIGCDDFEMKLFESQYVTPEGMCYNSYIILDDKVAVMDGVDSRKTEEWMEKMKLALGGRTPDYLIIQHMEPDHSGSVSAFLKEYPEAAVVASDKALKFLASSTKVWKLPGRWW